MGTHFYGGVVGKALAGTASHAVRSARSFVEMLLTIFQRP